LREIPHDTGIDSTLALLGAPYDFIAGRCRDLGTDVFQTRLALQPAICMSGPEAAELFYDPARFVRQGAVPAAIQKTLLGEGGVQGLDGAAHRHRKQLFLGLMTPERIAALAALTAEWWVSRARRWPDMDRVVLFDEARAILTRAVCDWTGVPLVEQEAARRANDLTAMFRDAGAIGPRHFGARRARGRSERWLAAIVEQVREGRRQAPPDSPLDRVVRHRELDGEPLDARTAAVELLNLLRPTVAVAVYVVFIADALHRHPECRRRLQAREAGFDQCFVQEVRRFYPFFPAVAARVRQDFEWRGYRFSAGCRVLLDLHGTNHDPRTWDEPASFQPDRFRHWDGGRFNFIPQGGGDHVQHHRCAGEWITLALMKVAADFLATKLSYEVPEQDLAIDRRRLPALPPSGFVLERVRLEARPFEA
jgi:fatty-acid peroxygenase